MTAREEGPARVGAALPPGFARRALHLSPGADRAADTAGWGDALVVVACGQVELERLGGARARFGRGDVLWVGAGSLRRLRNPGREPAVLVAVFRCADGAAGRPLTPFP